MNQDDPERHGLNFTQFVQAIDRGQFHAEMDETLRDLVAEMNNVYAEQRGKPKATIAITFDLTLDSGAIDVKTTKKVTTPKRAIGRTQFWSTPSNKLSRANPDQQKLPFADVNAAPKPIH